MVFGRPDLKHGECPSIGREHQNLVSEVTVSHTREASCLFNRALDFASRLDSVDRMTRKLRMNRGPRDGLRGTTAETGQRILDSWLLRS
jgi:hypothetical protein